MNNLVWLASYPRSGNTWLRALLTAYFTGEPAKLTNLFAPLVSSRAFLDTTLPLPLSELSPDQLIDCRFECYRRYSDGLSDQPYVFVKIHDALRHTSWGESFTNSTCTKCALYIARNPLDVAVSFAHYSGVSIQAAVNYLNDQEAGQCLNLTKGSVQVPQLLSSWGAHACSWLSCTEHKTLLIRYEDLLSATEMTFRRVLDSLEVLVDESRLTVAVAQAGFSQLDIQQQGERLDSGRLVRSGRVGQWTSELTDSQVTEIWNRNRHMMETLGYNGTTETGFVPYECWRASIPLDDGTLAR